MIGRFLPRQETGFLAEALVKRNDSATDAVTEWTIIPVFLFMICGLFSGGFTVALLFRRIAVALALSGPLLFSAIWIWWDWDRFHNRHFALGAFAVGFTLTFLALDREP